MTSDPICVGGRRIDMYGTNQIAADYDAGAVAFAVNMPEPKRRMRSKAGKVSPSDSQASVQWIACVQRIRDAQDEAAFSKLFQHFAPRVKGYLLKSGADNSLAEECVQDVMATVWRKAGQYDPSRASVSTWIFTIARNRQIDVLRKQARPQPEDLPWGPEAEPDQVDVLAIQQDSARLVDALSALPNNQREMIEKAYFGDLSHSEIAEVTGLPLGTIKSRIRMALDRLRQALKDPT